MNDFRILLLWLLVAMPVLADVPGVDDFAFAARLQIEVGKPFQELEIPSVVYQGISRWDLGDLRVLNAAGQVVPHGLAAPDTEAAPEMDAVAVPFYPLHRTYGGGDLAIDILPRHGGGVISIRQDGQSGGGQEEIQGYLLDLRELRHPLQYLELEWEPVKGRNRVRRLDLFRSDDLQHWQLLESGQVLADLAWQGRRLQQKRLHLDGVRTDFIKLVFTEAEPAPLISDVRAGHRQPSRLPEEHWLEVNVQASAQPGDYLFRLDNKVIPRRLRVRLPEDNTLVDTRVFSRPDPEQPWMLRGEQLLYRLALDGASLNAEYIDVAATRDRYWLLQFDQQGGGLGAGQPVVELAWRPRRLVFLARGQSPYWLVWGSARVAAVGWDAKRFMAATGVEEYDASLLGRAVWVPGSLREPNPAALRPEVPPPDWRRWLLWSLLLVSALLLVAMALRLFNRMKADE